MQSFRGIRAWRKAHAFLLNCHRVLRRFPREYGSLRAQLRKAAESIPTNIVEGCGRDSLNDYLRFLDIAFASVREVLYLLTIAKRLSLIDDASATSLIKLGDRVAGSLLNLRRSLRR